MAGSKFAYVRNFELPDPLLPGTFMVLRIDGHAFHRSVASPTTSTRAEIFQAICRPRLCEAK